ncbi:MAG: type IVB secretion system protein IcmV [Gammaproteobacteria bacterium]|nr:type IVB secretion system protein IcmV [Gammaproteobacteria bacterium]
MAQKEQNARAPARPPSRMGSFFGRIFKFRSWLDIERVQDFFAYMCDSSRRLLIPPKKGDTESFEAVIKELGLTDHDLQVQANALWWWSMLLLAVSAGIVAITIYHGLYGHLRACILSVLVTMVGLVAAFRYHFLYFQIKTRTLGCPIGTWFKQGVLGIRSQS